MKITAPIFILLMVVITSFKTGNDMAISRSFTTDSLGACQGISY